MTAKEYLTQAYRIDQRINSKLEQVASLRDLSTKATSTFSDVPPSGTRDVHRMEDVICEIVMLENECFKTWEQIAVQMNYSTKYVFDLHRTALKMVVVPETPY